MTLREAVKKQTTHPTYQRCTILSLCFRPGTCTRGPLRLKAQARVPASFSPTRARRRVKWKKAPQVVTRGISGSSLRQSRKPSLNMRRGLSERLHAVFSGIFPGWYCLFTSGRGRLSISHRTCLKYIPCFISRTSHPTFLILQTALLVMHNTRSHHLTTLLLDISPYSLEHFSPFIRRDARVN